MSFMDQPPTQEVTGGAPTFTLAPWIKRVGAALVDGVIVFLISFIGGLTGSDGVASLFSLIAFGFSIYNLVWLQGTTGQTIGKRLLNIRLVSEAAASPVGPLKAFLRQLAHILDAIPLYIGFLWPLWDRKRQTFADMISHTVVVES